MPDLRLEKVSKLDAKTLSRAMRETFGARYSGISTAPDVLVVHLNDVQEDDYWTAQKVVLDHIEQYPAIVEQKARDAEARRQANATTDSLLFDDAVWAGATMEEKVDALRHDARRRPHRG